MQLRLITLIAANAAHGAAQALNDLPRCAAAPFITAVQQSGCDINDAACVCTKQSVVQQISNGLLTACPPGDATKVLGFAFTWCGSLVNSTAEYGSAIASASGTALPPGITGSPNGTIRSNLTSCVPFTVTVTETLPAATSANEGTRRSVGLAALVVAIAVIGLVFAEL